MFQSLACSDSSLSRYQPPTPPLQVLSLLSYHLEMPWFQGYSAWHWGWSVPHGSCEIVIQGNFMQFEPKHRIKLVTLSPRMGYFPGTFGPVTHSRRVQLHSCSHSCQEQPGLPPCVSGGGQRLEGFLWGPA